MPRAIAVCSLGGLFPDVDGSGTAGPERLWELIRAGRDATGEPPSGRWLFAPASVHSSDGPAPDRVVSTRGGFVRGFAFDASGLDVDADTLAALDPSVLFALHAAREAWRGARTAALDPSRVGVVLGHIALPTERASALAEAVVGSGGGRADLRPTDAEVAALPARAIARALGLGGPAFTLDAACASSLFALHLACDELESGRVDAVLTGGVSRPDSLYTQMGFTQLRALSPSGRCRPFDRRGDGLVVGEGAAVFVVKRLADAERDGDDVLAVVRGVGVSNDVDGNLLAPSHEGQVRAMRAAYDDADWAPGSVQLVECHGTGTPVGDAVELRSLGTVRGDDAPCVVGSVKSNVGHLLTGAGAVGLAKVVLAMQHGELPPTAGFEEPHEALASPFEVLRAPRPWEAPVGTPRRAAVSAFGFGGTNAHVLVEQWDTTAGDASDATPPHAARDDVAVVAVAVRLGEDADVDAVVGRLLAGHAAETHRPFGALRIPAGRFRIPPTELVDMLPQQLLALDVAKTAVDAAGDTPADGLRTGVWFGVELGAATTDYHVRWSAQSRGRGGDALVPPLTANRTLGALAGVVATRIARELRLGGPCMSIADGAASGATALRLAMSALRRGDVDRAVVGAVDVTTDPRRLRVAEDGPFADGAVALVLHRAGDVDDPALVIAEPDAAAGDSASDEAATTVDDPAVVLGDAGAARELVHVAVAAELARRRVLTDGGDGRAAPWLAGDSEAPRRARAVTSSGAFDVVGRRAPARSVANACGVHVCVLDATDDAALAAELERLVDELGSGDAADVSRRAWQRAGAGPRRLALVAADATELRARALEALTALRDGLPTGPGVHLPREGAPGRVAFVYPGSGSHYEHMARDLSVSFPGPAGEATGGTRRLVSPEVAWQPPESLDLADHGPLLRAHVGVGIAVTGVLRAFGVEPDAAVGYSLGESTAHWALRAWTDREEMWRRLDETTLFRNELAGRCDAARRAWGLPEDEPIEWSVGIVHAPASRVRDTLAGRARAHLLIANTDEQCVVGGRAEDVAALVRDLGCDFVPVPGVTTVHCEVVEPVAGRYRALHVFEDAGLPRTGPSALPEGFAFYSPAWGRPYEPGPETSADSILEQALHGFDFTAVVRRMWDDGVRVFVETGPGGACTSMIRDVLAGRPHVAVPVCTRRGRETTTFLNALGALWAAGRAVDLSPLYGAAGGDVGRAAPTVVRPRAEWLAESREVTSAPTSAARSTSPVPAPEPASSSVPAPEPVTASVPVPDRPPSPDGLASGLAAAAVARADAHGAFLALEAGFTRLAHANLALQTSLVAHAPAASTSSTSSARAAPPAAATPSAATTAPPRRNIAFDRAACLEFGRGSIGAVLGERFAPIDAHPTRVRLPDEPLMLVDRIVSVEGEQLRLGPARTVTEHDVGARPWYLEAGRVPTSIAIESGQADLFLCAWLGMDFLTRGLAVYRLLDAAVTFHGPLPRRGEVVRYDIRIERWFRQGETHLFRFGFEGSVDGRPVLTMRDGCAGFFSPAELAAGQGVVLTERDRAPATGRLPGDWRAPAAVERCALGDDAMTALRDGDLQRAFGPAFASVPLAAPAVPPSGRMALIDRITELDPAGGRFGIGLVRGEIDIAADAWFLTCHFTDDEVMPGTLMYECSLQTLRVFLMRLGFVGERGAVVYEPVPGVTSRLRCRGQVVGSTSVSAYEVHVKEIGYRPEPGGAPYAIADALMYADGRLVVQMTDMSLQVSGADRTSVEALFAGASRRRLPARIPAVRRAGIEEFASGRPSAAWGPAYAPFDAGRFVARLPAPPFLFVDEVDPGDAPPFAMLSGGTVRASYAVPPDAWYLHEARADRLPYAVLNEVALQTCGWFAAYMGSALTSEHDLRFRNLGGEVEVLRDVAPGTVLHTTATCTGVSPTDGMIVQHYRFDVRDGAGESVYRGTTYFGFFTAAALGKQVGLGPFTPAGGGASGGTQHDEIPDRAPFPRPRWRMIARRERIDVRSGVARASIDVDRGAWFFEAHFKDDPVWPGSLGLEALVQLLHHCACERFGDDVPRRIAPASRHTWSYRGQIVPSARRVTVEATSIVFDDAARTVTADGRLVVDGLVIYETAGFVVGGR